VAKNQLYYGDNLEVLRQHLKDESVDLIYVDLPFNSRQDYNVLFAEKDGTRSRSQIMAFEDTWEWNVDAERSNEEIVEQGGRWRGRPRPRTRRIRLPTEPDQPFVERNTWRNKPA
jgi:16S rRNA G966 N2-methylase RsmD